MVGYNPWTNRLVNVTKSKSFFCE